LLLILLAGCGSHAGLSPALGTQKVAGDPDDPAVWIHPQDPARSLILGTVKEPAPMGAIVVFGIDGMIRQTIPGIDRPNNIDVEYELMLGGKPVSIAVTTERLRNRLRVFAIAGDGSGIRDVSSGGGIPVFVGQRGEEAAPMGIALYRRTYDGAVFAIVSRKWGPRHGYLWQYRLEDDGAGMVKGTKVREFGSFSGLDEIEAVAVDDELGYVYYADESTGIRKWHADPDHPEAGKELAVFGVDGFRGNREGIAIYTLADRKGYIICTDQISGGTRFHVFRREGAADNPNDHSEAVFVVSTTADSTDGIEATSASLGPNFPNGAIIAMNSGPQNFVLFRWEDIAGASRGKLSLRER